MKKIVLFISIGLITGCLETGYNATEVTDKFSDPNAPKIVSMTNNNIDFSAPFVEFSELNAFASINRSSNKIVNVGVNVRIISNDTWTSAKWLNIRKGDQIIFLADGKRIVGRAFNSSIDHSTENNSVTGINTDYYDYASYILTTKDFKNIVNATNLEFKVEGRNGSIAYPRNGFSLLTSFQKNLRQFYDKEIETRI